MVAKKASGRPTFSIVLPTHNRPDVIGFAIESVLLQTDQDFELLIVGDGCKKDTVKAVSKYLSDPRIKWFNLPKAPGFGYANRNIVFKKAVGKYIAFIADDDLFLPDHLSLIRQHFEKNPNLTLIYSRPLWADSKGNIAVSASNLNHPKSFNLFMKKGNTIPASCFVHKRSCFNDIGFWDEKILNAGDWDFYKRVIASNNGSFGFESTPTAIHFVANWRPKNTFYLWPHAQLHRIASKYRLLPKGLHTKIPKGRSEQSIIWEQIKQSPENWSSEVRKQTQAMTDAVNHFYIPIAYQAEADLAKLRVELKKQGQELAKKTTELDRLRNSLTIRIKQKVIKLVRVGSLQHRLLSRSIRKIVDARQK